MLGLGLAFLWEALETRARTAEEVSARLGGLPLLGRVPEPPKRLRRAGKLVMLEEPASVQAEAFRMLRAKLDFVTLDRDVRTIMVTSALEQEGKSTTVANLAVAFARAGKRVVLVDLDLRRPVLARFFDLKGPGLTQVALGHVPLEEALTQIVIADPPRAEAPAAPRRGGDGNGNRTRELSGLLEVLPSGPIPPDPGEFVSSPALGMILQRPARALRTSSSSTRRSAARRRRDRAELARRRDRRRRPFEGPAPADARRAQPAARDDAGACAGLGRHRRSGGRRLRRRL